MTQSAGQKTTEKATENSRRWEPLSETDEQISLHIRADFPILWVSTFEEPRFLRQLGGIRDDILKRRGESPSAEPIKKPVVYWSSTMGLQYNDKSLMSGQTKDKQSNPDEALRLIATNRPPTSQPDIDWDSATFVFSDLHPWLDANSKLFDPFLIRRLRDLANHLRTTDQTLILLSPVARIPLELEKDITLFDYPFPTPEQLDDLLQFHRAEIEREDKYGADAIQLTPEERKEMMRAACGLTYEEVENVWAKALASDGKITKKHIPLFLEEKRQIIQKTGFLEFFPNRADFKSIGGLDNLKEWLADRELALKQDSIKINGRPIPLPQPKGILLIGVPGCGKSLAAKAIASEWGLPLLRLDVGKIYEAYVGSSEANIRRAIQIAENLAPVVLWIDEVEKGFPRSEGSTDSGTSLRVLGTFLNWMQEKTKLVFVCATANDIKRMPPELTRKGRFDEIFYVGLPTQQERAEIFRIHTQMAGWELESEALEGLAGQTDSYSGAEIEQVVNNAKFGLNKYQNEEGNPFLKSIEAVIKGFFPFAQRPDERSRITHEREEARLYAAFAGKKAEEMLDDRPQKRDGRF